MKFYEHADEYEHLCRMFPESKVSRQEYYWSLLSNPKCGANEIASWSDMWRHEQKPYYDVYPSVIPMLSRISLEFPSWMISMCQYPVMPKDIMKATSSRDFGCKRKFPALLIRLPVGKSITFEDRGKKHEVQAIRSGILRGRTDTGLVFTICVYVGEVVEGVPVYSIRTLNLSSLSVEEAIRDLPIDDSYYEGVQVPESVMTSCMRIAIALQLLEDNPEIIEPDVLSADRNRFTNADEELRKRLVDKARQRGKNGFRIGANLEVIPHYRRPHPAIVWTGTGKAIPKLIFRSGSIVHRSAVESMPTGYMDADPE